MKKMIKASCVACLLAMVGSGCGHVNSSKVGLVSFGNLEGKTIPDSPTGPIVEGSDAGSSCFLSEASRNALKNTGYDTLVDVDVTTETGFLVTSNKVTVRGTALDSRKLGNPGGEQ